jgi:Uma2 family endonuclease
MRRYAGSGIPDYRLCDSRIRALEAYRLGPNGYELIGIYRVADVFRPELFPGLEIPIDELWA